MLDGLNNVILVLFGLTALSAVVVVGVNLVRRNRAERHAPAAERTPEQKAQDRASEKTWLIILAAVVIGLAAVYLLFS